MQIKEQNGQLLVRTEYAMVVIQDDMVQVLTGLHDNEMQSKHCVEIYPVENQVFIDPESDRKQQVGLVMIEGHEYVTVNFDETGRSLAIHESNIRRQPPGDPSDN